LAGPPIVSSPVSHERRPSPNPPAQFTVVPFSEMKSRTSVRDPGS
jgi:hypothetical protein